MRLTFVPLLGVLAAGGAAAQPATRCLTAAARSSRRAARSSSTATPSRISTTSWSGTRVRRNWSSPRPIACARLPADQRAAFEQAREHYKVFATPGGDRLLLALRYRLAGFGDFGLADASAVEAALARAVDRRRRRTNECWWPDARRSQPALDRGHRAAARGRRGCTERAPERALRGRPAAAAARGRRELLELRRRQ